MKRLTLVILYSYSISFMFAIEIHIQTELSEFTISVASEAREVSVNNITEGTTRGTTIKRIKGLESLPNLDSLFIRYFDFEAFDDVRSSGIKYLQLYWSNHVCLSKLLELPLRGLSLRTVFFDKEPVIDASNSVIDYLEISGSNLINVPRYIGEIRVINLSYNGISNINPSIFWYYTKCEYVILIGNNIWQTLPSNFIVKGNIFDLLPIEYQRFVM